MCIRDRGNRGCAQNLQSITKLTYVSQLAGAAMMEARLKEIHSYYSHVHTTVLESPDV